MSCQAPQALLSTGFQPASLRSSVFKVSVFLSGFWSLCTVWMLRKLGKERKLGF
uniref:Uncharacterized protein n=1 Tax=Rhizophora mucronata TaxID=61149 RepID=A0A2P2KQ15_RHIMU